MRRFVFDDEGERGPGRCQDPAGGKGRLHRPRASHAVVDNTQLNIPQARLVKHEIIIWFVIVAYGIGPPIKGTLAAIWGDYCILHPQIDRLRGQYAELEDVSHPVTEGDYAVINLSASVNGVEIDELTANDLTYPVGSNSFVPGLDAQVMGSSAGSIVKYNETLPDSFGEHGGKEVTFQVLVKGVKTQKLPEVTDEWVEEVSEFATIDALKDELREGLREHKLAATRREFADKVLEELIEDMDVDLPKGLLDAEMEFQMHRFLHRLEEQKIPVADYLSVTGQTEEDFIEDARRQAERSLSVRVLLDAVGEAEGIDVPDEELQEAMTALATSSDQTPEEYEKDLRESGQVDVLTGDILRNKVIDRLVAAAVPVDENGAELSLDAVERPDEAMTEDAETEEE